MRKSCVAGIALVPLAGARLATALRRPARVDPAAPLNLGGAGGRALPALLAPGGDAAAPKSAAPTSAPVALEKSLTPAAAPDFVPSAPLTGTPPAAHRSPFGLTEASPLPVDAR